LLRNGVLLVHEVEFVFELAEDCVSNPVLVVKVEQGGAPQSAGFAGKGLEALV